MDYKKSIEENKDTLIELLGKLVSYKTIENKKEAGTVFGLQNKLCLEEYLKVANEFGFIVKNLDDYCGYVQYGSGDKTVGVVGHLDVVPTGDNWETDPFTLTFKDGYLYGRGTSDDKGAVAASLIALKIIKDLDIKLNKKVGLIVGCNEETGSLCMKHYMEQEGAFDLGFTPDADFPCINGEKGIIHATFTCDDFNIIDINGGIATNVVPDKCTLNIKNNSFDIDIFKQYLEDNKLNYDIKNNDDILDITVYGKSSHASLPDQGINAITHTLYALYNAKLNDSFIKDYFSIFDTENNGKKLNINLEDDYSKLTLVNSTIKKENNKIIGTIDIRVPITIDNEVIIEKLINTKSNIKFNIDMEDKSLYYPLNSELVQKLMKAYQDVTHDYNSKPKVIGGGTYAKSLKNCIAFGCEFVPNKNNIHDANERVSLKELLTQVELYVHAIVELAK